MEQFREAKKWLLAREDDQLVLSDDLEMFYKVSIRLLIQQKDM